jgi:hypothetical protein
VRPFANTTEDRVVGIVPVAVAEVVRVVEIVPVRVVEIVPVFVVEIVPLLAKLVIDIAKIKSDEQTVTFRVFIGPLLVLKRQGCGRF